MKHHVGNAAVFLNSVSFLFCFYTKKCKLSLYIFSCVLHKVIKNVPVIMDFKSPVLGQKYCLIKKKKNTASEPQKNNLMA